jgi:hypothetical protein
VNGQASGKEREKTVAVSSCDWPDSYHGIVANSIIAPLTDHGKTVSEPKVKPQNDPQVEGRMVSDLKSQRVEKSKGESSEQKDLKRNGPLIRESTRFEHLESFTSVDVQLQQLAR